MVKQFLRLEWKSFTRSASFNLHIALKIIIGVAVAFYCIMFLFLGAGVYFILAEEHLEPLSSVNQYLLFWWLLDLVIRYFFQKTPVMRTKPFLVLPVKRNQIIHFLLGKSSFSFFNLYPAFFFLPFSIVLGIHGYSILGIVAWNIGILSLVLLNNYINILVNNIDQLFIGIALVLASFVALRYYQIFDITPYISPLFQAFYNWSFLGILIAVFPVSLYIICYRYFEKRLYLDDLVKKQSFKIEKSNYEWLNKFGTLGTFLKNDIRLIRRNKRARSTVLLSFFFLFYGLLFVNNPVYQNPNWDIFCGIFVTGGFLFTFGGYVPSWDSSYYPFMMSQNIQYKEYLSAKWWLMVIAVAFSALLSSFYLYFGWDIFKAMMVGAIYNIGVNAYLVLWGGAYVKTPIDLEAAKKMFGDKKAFNINTILITLPKIVLPILVFYIVRIISTIDMAYIAVALLGGVGLVFRDLAFRWIEKIYKREKYSAIAAYKQKNNG
jgi:hypothetical protein